MMDNGSRPFQWTEDEKSNWTNWTRVANCFSCGSSGYMVLQMRRVKADTRTRECSSVWCRNALGKWLSVHCASRRGLLVGLEQIDSAYCYDCLLLERIRKKQEKQKESRSLGSGKASVKGISKENRKWPWKWRSTIPGTWQQSSDRAYSPRSDWVSEQFLNGTSAHDRPFQCHYSDCQEELLCQQKATPGEHFISSGSSSNVVQNSSEDFIDRLLYDYRAQSEG